MGALGVGSPTGCPQGPNFRDEKHALLISHGHVSHFLS